jgi:50S ribosomal protein L16 3-hydroxylase
MQQLADDRALSAATLRRTSEGAKSLLQDWIEAGWIHEF